MWRSVTGMDALTKSRIDTEIALRREMDELILKMIAALEVRLDKLEASA